MGAALLAAIRFLTRFPVPEPGELDERRRGMQVLFFPLVGLLLGAALWASAALLGNAPPAASAALLLFLWVWTTGGLHLDGLADSADAWVGGIGSRDRTLEIMKDPALGAMGAVALILVLIGKWAGMTVLVDGDAAVLLWLPVLARTQLLLVFLTTPYVGRGGLGGRLAAELPRRQAWLVVAFVWGACLVALGPPAWALALACAVTFALWRRGMSKRLGGFTGDTAGALVELTEVAALLCLAVLQP